MFVIIGISCFTMFVRRLLLLLYFFLQHVTVSQYKLSLHEFSSILKTPDLRSLSLDLTNCPEFSVPEFEKVFSGKEDRRLVELNLKLNQLEDRHLDSIGRGCQNLEDLSLEENLQENETSKTTASGFEDLFKNCGKLKLVKLSLKNVENLDNLLSEEFSIRQEKNFVVLQKKNC